MLEKSRSWEPSCTEPFDHVLNVIIEQEASACFFFPLKLSWQGGAVLANCQFVYIFYIFVVVVVGQGQETGGPFIIIIIIIFLFMHYMSELCENLQSTGERRVYPNILGSF